MANLMVSNITQEDKELLLRDLSARLPYGVMCATTDNDGSLPNIWRVVKADMINKDFFLIHDSYKADRIVDVKEVKPYLFPLSSMTEEQTEELIKIINTGQNDNNEFMRSICRIDFYHKHHFDYRGLISMDLAIDATNLGIYE